MDNENNHSDHTDKIIFITAALLLLGKWLEFSWSWVIKSPIHMAMVAGPLILLTFFSIKIAWSKIRKNMDNRKFEKTITSIDADSVFCGTTDKNEDINQAAA